MALTNQTLITPTIIAKEALMLLENELVMGNLVHRQYKKEFKKVGQTIEIRKPVKFTVTKARTRTSSGVTESYDTLTVSTQAHVSWAFATVDLTMTIEEYSERYIKPAVAALANQVDEDLCALYDDIANSVYESTGFVDPESFIVLGQAGRKLDEEAVPRDSRCIVLNPAANWSLANALKNMFVTEVSKPALTKGYLGRVANFEIYMDQNIKVHTTGDYHDTGSTAALLVGTTAGGGSGGLGTDAKSISIGDFRIIASKALKVGDVFTVANVYACNPMNGDSTGQLRQFTVTADASCIKTGTATTGNHWTTVYFEPPMIDTGAYKNIDTLPAAGAAVTIIGNEGEPYPQNLSFYKNAFALVCVPLEMPANVWGARQSSRVSGLSIRVIKDYDIDTDAEIIRLDILYGVKTLYMEMACRIWGAEG